MSNDDQKFLKSNRLLHKNDFQNLKTGSRFFASDALIFYIKKNELNETRIGMAISKKFGAAPHRNKLKRKIREWFRKSEFKSEGFDILVCPNLKKLKAKNLSRKKVYELVDESLMLSFKSIIKSF